MLNEGRIVPINPIVQLNYSYSPDEPDEPYSPDEPYMPD